MIETLYPATPPEPDAPTPAVDGTMEVDPIGDYFGDYSGYSLLNSAWMKMRVF